MCKLVSPGAKPTGNAFITDFSFSEPKDGLTAFMMVCREGHELCVQYFLNAVCIISLVPSKSAMSLSLEISGC